MLGRVLLAIAGIVTLPLVWLGDRDDPAPIVVLAGLVAGLVVAARALAGLL